MHTEVAFQTSNQTLLYSGTNSCHLVKADANMDRLCDMTSSKPWSKLLEVNNTGCNKYEIRFCMVNYWLHLGNFCLFLHAKQFWNSTTWWHVKVLKQSQLKTTVRHDLKKIKNKIKNAVIASYCHETIQ